MMRHSHFACCLTLTLMLLSGCNGLKHADNTMAARTGIEETNAQWADAFNRGDAAAVAILYTEDAQVLPPNGAIVNGQAGAQTLFQGLIDAKLQVRLRTVEVEGHGDTAYEVGWATIMGSDGQTLDEGKYIVIWKRVGGMWKLHRDMWNSNMPQP